MKKKYSSRLTRPRLEWNLTWILSLELDSECWRANLRLLKIDLIGLISPLSTLCLFTAIKANIFGIKSNVTVLLGAC